MILNNHPNVSVIIPTYNRAKSLERAVRSVLDQTFQNFEIIIINDGSTDNTENVIKNFSDSRIKYIKHSKNRGVAAARNTGIKIARGKFIAFQDSDDEWLPIKLEEQMKVFSNSSLDVGVVYSDMYKIYNKKRTYHNNPTVIYKKIINTKTLRYQAEGLRTPAVIIRKKAIDKIGFFDERFLSFEDLDLFIRLSEHYKFYHIKKSLAIYNLEIDNLTFNYNYCFIGRKLLLKKYMHLFKNNKKFLANQYFKMFRLLQRSNQFPEAEKYFKRAIKLDFFNAKFLAMMLLLIFGQNFCKKTLDIYLDIKKTPRVIHEP